MYASGIMYWLNVMSSFICSIIKMQEAGLITRWRQKWWRSSDKCGSGGIKSNADGLGLDSTGGPFLIFLFSVVIAFLGLVGEVILSKYNERKTVRNEIMMETKMPS